MFEADVERILDEIVPVGRRIGVRCDRAMIDEVRLVLYPAELAWNHLGTVYAGAIFALAELTAGALAAIGASPAAVPVLVSSRLEFVRPAAGPVVCVSVPPHEDLFSGLPELLRHDHRTASTFEARCESDGREVARAEFTYRWLVSGITEGWSVARDDRSRGAVDRRSERRSRAASCGSMMWIIGDG